MRITACQKINGFYSKRLIDSVNTDDIFVRVRIFVQKEKKLYKREYHVIYRDEYSNIAGIGNRKQFKDKYFTIVVNYTKTHANIGIFLPR